MDLVVLIHIRKGNLNGSNKYMKLTKLFAVAVEGALQ